jgi:hypothetical protein
LPHYAAGTKEHIVTDIRTMFDNRYLYHFDLPHPSGTVVEIAKVEPHTVEDPRTKTKQLKPLVYFKGVPRGLVFNKTNMKTVGTLYGYKAEDWVGKRIILFVTTTSAGGQSVECIRVKPQIPPAAKEQADA